MWQKEEERGSERGGSKIRITKIRIMWRWHSEGQSRGNERERNQSKSEKDGGIRRRNVKSSRGKELREEALKNKEEEE